MRLRLSVQRNNLPATNILWSVSDTNSKQAYTIARLLEDVNRVVPLEAEQWGLEDYTVEVGGFECLHFSPVSQSLKDDDHVSIRPLLTAEVRSRTLCGRHQISEDGRHLVDGIPFGRPYLRQPNRPVVRIPPRKRRRVEEEPSLGDTEPVGLINNGPELLQIENGPAISPRDKQAHRGGSDKTVRFTQVEVDGMDDSDEEDEEFAPSGDSDSEISTSSDSDASSASDTSDDSDGASGDASSGSDSDSDSDSSSSDDSEANSLAPEVMSSKPPKPLVPPNQGTPETKSRNRRRAQLEKLKRLKKEGILHQDAAFEDLRAYEKEHQTPQTSHSPSKPMSAPNGKRKRYDEESTTDSISPVSELERRKMELMASLEKETTSTSGTPNNATPKTATPVATPDRLSPQMDASMEAAPEPTPDTRPSKGDAEATPPKKRLRPDTNAIKRMLGHQTKNIEKKLSRAKAPVEKSPEPEGASEPDFWKSRINLSAFECWHEEYELSAPPFPFKQHWDPASKQMREKSNQKRNKKSRKSQQERERSAEREETPEPIILDYDDAPDTSKRDSDPTDAIEEQLMQDVQVAAQTDLPPLPDDVEALPALEPKDIQVGAIAVFKRWTIDPKTVTPEISDYMTAIVEKEGDSGAGAGTLRLRFAARDVPKREEEVNANGEKVMSARDGFRMEIDGEEEDESIWDCTFGELIGPKLLKSMA